MQRKHQKTDLIVIDGVEFAWTILRDTQWTSRDEYQGITISVRKTGPERRELLLKYPFLGVKPAGNWHTPEKLKITPNIVEAGIREAIEGGWNPNSRGRTYTWFVEEAPS